MGVQNLEEEVSHFRAGTAGGDAGGVPLGESVQETVQLTESPQCPLSVVHS